MNVLKWGKDGGSESSVWGFWLIEIKWLFSIVLLRFDEGTREAFHDHAFDAISWLFTGRLIETRINKDTGTTWEGFDLRPSLLPILTYRWQFHKVRSEGVSWALSFRGPWSLTWHEIRDGQLVTLAHGRKELT